jgi:hypothetical protein
MPSKAKRLGRWLGSTGAGKKAYIELIDALTPKAE